MLNKQRYPTSSQPYRISMIYFLITFLLSLIPFSSHIWTNLLSTSSPPTSTISLPSEQQHLLPHSLISNLFSGPILNWNTQIVLITGGSSGLGLVLVETLAVMGVEVIVIDKKGYVGQWGEFLYFVGRGQIRREEC